jgi:hypothetical protein
MHVSKYSLIFKITRYVPKYNVILKRWGAPTYECNYMDYKNVNLKLQKH